MTIRRHRHQYYNHRGFSVIELLIVIIVISALVLVVTAGYGSVKRNATVALLQSDLKQAAKQLNIYRVDHSGQYPLELSELNNGDGLKFTDRASTIYVPKNDESPPDYCLSASVDDVVLYVSRFVVPSEGDPCENPLALVK